MYGKLEGVSLGESLVLEFGTEIGSYDGMTVGGVVVKLENY